MKIHFAIKQDADYDVVVVGGGTTGVAAAIAAARQGARTALVEYYGFLGGNAATGLAWLGFHARSGEKVVGGIAQEMIDRLRRVGGATAFYPDPIVGSLVGVNSHWWKLIAMESVASAGVEVLLHALVVGVDQSEGATGQQEALGLYVQSRGGVSRLGAKVVVDCTDSGAVAGMAGANRVRGRAGDGKVQVASWTFQVGGVDFDPMVRYFDRFPDQMRPFPLSKTDMARLLRQIRTAEVFVLGAFGNLIQLARKEGFSLPRDNLPGIAHRPEGMLTLVGTRVEEVNPDDTVGFSGAEMEGARQAVLWIRFLKEYVPGCAGIFLCGTPHQIGLRETYHVEGDYLLTGEDLLAGKTFEDGIALGAYHLDIHSPDHGGIETGFPPPYQIPYRSLIPQGVGNLLVAGRAISATHEAMASTRVIPIGMAMGQAAGMAAGMAASEGRGGVRTVDTDALRRSLRQAGAILETGVENSPPPGCGVVFPA